MTRVLAVCLFFAALVWHVVPAAAQEFNNMAPPSMVWDVIEMRESHAGHLAEVYYSNSADQASSGADRVLSFDHATFALLAAPAAASENCAPYDALAKALEQRYGEAPVERGLSNAGEIVEWWGNPETGTWTVVTHSAAGVGCILAAGEPYETVAAVPKGVDG